MKSKYLGLLKEAKSSKWETKSITKPWLMLKPQHQNYLRELYALVRALESAYPARWAYEMLQYRPFYYVRRLGPHSTHYVRDGRFEPWHKNHVYYEHMQQAKDLLKEHGIPWKIDKDEILLIECWYDDKNIHNLCPWQDICKIRL